MASKRPLEPSAQDAREWPPHPWDLEILSDARHCLEHGRQQVGVLVRVQVRWLKARFHDTPDLRGQFVIDADAPQRHCTNELHYSGWKRRRSHQDQVATDVERRVFL